MKQFKKYIITLFLALGFCLGGFAALGFSANKNDTPYTQEYINYLNLSDEEKSKLQVIPEKYPVIIDESNKIYIRDLKQLAAQNELEDYFNLKNEIVLYTENQAQMGICWAFSSLKSLETFMALNYGEYWNFSEGFVAYARAKKTGGDIDAGGNWLYFMDAFKTYGVLAETFMPYEMMNSITKSNMQHFSYVEQYADTTYDKLVEQVVFKASESGLDAVKTHIKQNGSLYMPINSSAMRSGKNGYYVANSNKLSINHAVSIIGWDDNFSASNFPDLIKPTTDGAFIALNSYGAQWGNDGIFYVSYEDIYITDALLYGFKSKQTNNNEEILKFEEISSPTSTYQNPDMKNMFNLGDNFSLNYKLTNNLGFAPDVELVIRKNGVDLTESFLITQNKTQTQTNVGISTQATLEAGIYTIEFKNNNNTHIKNFVIVSRAEISSIASNAMGPYNMFNTINGQTKTFSAPYFETTYNGYRKYIDLYIFVEKQYSQIQSISVNGVLLSYLDSTGKYFGTVTASEKDILDMVVTTKKGHTETYKIFVMTNNSFKFYVHYNLNGGINSQLNPTLYHTEYADYHLIKPVKPNYVFDAWYVYEVRPENKITYLTRENWGTVVLVANWKLPEYSAITANYKDNLGNDIEESQGLQYGYASELTANFTYLNSDDFEIKWLLNSQHITNFDNQTTIYLQLEVGSYTVKTQAVKNSIVIASQTKTFVVNKKILNLTWENLNLVYNSQRQAPTASISGLVGTDTYELEFVYESDDEIIEKPINAGNYKVKINNLSNDNYVIEDNFEKTFTIAKANLTITAKNVVAKYSDELFNVSKNYDLSGINYNNEVDIKVTTTATSHKAGQYEITVQAANPNYNITIKNATYTILDGTTYIYQLPTGAKVTYYIDQNQPAPKVKDFYNPMFYIVKTTELSNENGVITYKVENLSIVPIVVAISPILLFILFKIISRTRRKKWR